MIRSRIAAIILAGALAFSLAACGSSETAEETAEPEQTFETETPSESESEEPEEEESRLAPDGVWETDGERVTIEGDTVTIDYVDENGDVSETYWVGSFELNEDSDTWTSTRDPDAEMTAECDTIEFEWEGTDNVYDTLSYVVTNEDGTKKTVRLERTESLGEVAEGVVPDFGGEADAVANSSTSASDSNRSDTSSAQSSAETKTSDGGTSAATNMSADTNTSADAGTSSSAQTSGNAGSSAQSGSTGSAAGGSSSSGSSGSTASSSGGSSSGSSGSSGTAAAACSHNYAGTTTKAASCTSAGTMTYTCTKCGDSYQAAIPATGHSYNGGTVTKAATCSSAGTTTYTCTKCGDSYTTSIPATGNHNWQAVYRTESVKVKDAVYEDRIVCNVCFNFSSVSKMEVDDHIYFAHNGIGGFTSKSVCIQDAVYENQQVLDHYVCSACGATK